MRCVDIVCVWYYADLVRGPDPVYLDPYIWNLLVLSVVYGCGNL
jgi:hypothetical protein